MPKQVNKSGLFSGERLWTCDPGTRKMLLEEPDSVSRSLIQHARTADSVSVVKAKDGEATRVRRFRITTENKDRHGDVVRSKGAMLKHFKKNPVVLFAHDASMPPVGRSPKLERGEGFMDADVDFFDRETYEFADTIFRIVSVGGLKATSIGFIPLEFDRLTDEQGEKLQGIDFKKWDLLEFSIVPIPANPEAVGRAMKDGAGMKSYIQWLDNVQDHWDETKFLMDAFDVDEADMMEVRKAAMGERTVHKAPDISTFISKEQQDDILQKNLKAVKGAAVDEGEDTTEEESAAHELSVDELSSETDDIAAERSGDGGSVPAEMADADEQALEDKAVEQESANEADSEEPDNSVQELSDQLDGLEVQEVVGRKSNWESQESFFEWAEENGFSTDNVIITQKFWRLKQRDGSEFKSNDLRSLPANPIDEPASSSACKAYVVAGEIKSDQHPVTALVEQVRSLAAELDYTLDEEAIKAAEVYANMPVNTSGIPAHMFSASLSAVVGGMCAQRRAMDLAFGVFGKDLNENEVKRLSSSEHCFTEFDDNFELPDGCELDDADSDTAKFVRMSYEVGLTAGRIKVVGLRAETLAEAEDLTRKLTDIGEDSDYIFFIGRCIGEFNGDAVYQDESAFRWLADKGTVRLGLGKRVLDPLDNLETLAKALGEEDRTYNEEEEQKLTDAVALLSAILDDISDKKSGPEDDEDDDDFDIAKYFGLDTDEGEDEEEDDDTTKSITEDDPLGEATSEELGELVAEILREEAPEATASVLKGVTSKLTGALD